jgi:hypothetical protein
MATTYVQTENIISRHIGDDIVVIKDDGLSTHILNDTAGLIWELCDGKNGIEEITSKFCEDYEVTFEVARADVQDRIVKFIEVDIVKPVEEKGS